MVENLDTRGWGVNLSRGEGDGILDHSVGRGPIFARDGGGPAALEGQLVRVSDIIACLAHDLDDAFRAGLLTPEEVPPVLTETFGPRSSTRIGAMVDDLLANSSLVEKGAGAITDIPRPTPMNDNKNGAGVPPLAGQGLAFSEKMEEMMNTMREFLYHRVYQAPKLVDSLEKADRIIEEIYLRIPTHPARLIKY